MTRDGLLLLAEIIACIAAMETLTLDHLMSYRTDGVYPAFFPLL